MGNCLVTKLKGSISNNELLRIGEMRIRIAKVEDPTDATQGLEIDVNKSVVLKIVSDGYFTDKALNVNKGKTITLNAGINGVWVSNNDVEIAILDKYSITKISRNYPNQTSAGYGSNIYLNLSDLKYSTALTSLDLSGAQVTGDIANLKGLTALISLDLRFVPVTGDIAAIKPFSKLNNAVLNHVTGDISAINGTKLTSIIISNSGGLSGDISKLKSDFIYLGLDGDKTSKFTWSLRDTNSCILGNGGSPILLSNLDNMLTNMSQCRNGLTSTSPIYYKTIQYQGNRTSASDRAVATLQEYGYTVVITKA